MTLAKISYILKFRFHMHRYILLQQTVDFITKNSNKKSNVSKQDRKIICPNFFVLKWSQFQVMPYLCTLPKWRPALQYKSNFKKVSLQTELTMSFGKELLHLNETRHPLGMVHWSFSSGSNGYLLIIFEFVQ